MMKDEDFKNLMRQTFTRIEKQKMSKGNEEDRSQDCLSEETICNYVDSNLSEAELDKVEGHLFHCPSCLEFVIDIIKVKELAHKEIPGKLENTELRIKERLIQVIKTFSKLVSISLAWVEGHLTLKDTNATYLPCGKELKPLLSRDVSNKEVPSLPFFSKTFEDYKIDLWIIEEEEEKCGIQCKVFPVSEKKQGTSIKVELVKAEKTLRSFLLENDTFILQGISPGEYNIYISDGKHLIANISIDIER